MEVCERLSILGSIPVGPGQREHVLLTLDMHTCASHSIYDDICYVIHISIDLLFL